MPGASGCDRRMTVVRSPPDGHTLLVGSNSVTILAPLVFTQLPVNTKRDLVPIALLFNFRSCWWRTQTSGEDLQGIRRLRQGAARSA